MRTWRIATCVGGAVVAVALLVGPLSVAHAAERATVFIAFDDAGVDAAFPMRLRIEVRPLWANPSSPTGTLTLTEDGRVLARVPVENQWAFASLAFSAGTHEVKASYSGDDNFLPATRAANISASRFTYDAASSVYAGTSCPPPGICDVSYVGQPVTFWFGIMLTRFPPHADMGADGVIPPTGTVTFFEGRTRVSSVALHGFSTTYTTSALGVGVHLIHAEYTGDENYAIYGILASRALTVLPSPDPTRPPPALPPPSLTKPDPFHVGTTPLAPVGGTGPGPTSGPTTATPRPGQPPQPGLAIPAVTATQSPVGPGAAPPRPAGAVVGDAPANASPSAPASRPSPTAAEESRAAAVGGYRAQAQGIGLLWPGADHGRGMPAWLSWLAVALLAVSGAGVAGLTRRDRSRRTEGRPARAYSVS